MGLFSVICLILIPMPTFILGTAMFVHMLRDERYEASAGSIIAKAVLIACIGLFAVGGVLWILMCLSLVVRGPII